MLVDLILDFFLKKYQLKDFESFSDQFFERQAFLLLLAFPGLVFLTCRANAFMPPLYLSCCYWWLMATTFLVFNGVAAELQRFSLRALQLAGASAGALVASELLKLYAYYFDMPSLDTASDVLLWIAVAALLALSCRWASAVVLPQLASQQDLSAGEYRCAVFLAAAIVLFTGTMLVNLLADEEAAHACLTLLRTGFTVLVAVLPGRQVRMSAIAATESMSLKQVFVRHISHEIRSPLNVVHAGLDLLLSELKQQPHTDRARIEEQLGDIFVASGAAVAVLDDLLSLEHLGAGTFRLDLAWRPLRGLFEDEFRWASLLAEGGGVGFRLLDETAASKAEEDPAEDSLSEAPLAQACLRLDPFRLRQVLRHLLDHAVRQSAGRGEVRVRIRCLEYGQDLPQAPGPSSDPAPWPLLPRQRASLGVLRVEVQDSGPGVAPEDRAALLAGLDRYSRAELRGGGGFGLALWISKRVMDLHQGHLGFSSGGCFFFELPLFAPQSESTAHLTQHSGRGQEEEGPGSLHLWLEGPSSSPEASRSEPYALEAPPDRLLDPTDPSPASPRCKRRSWGSRVFPDPLEACLVQPFQTPSRPPLRFLVVDDSPLNRKVVRRILEAAAGDGLPAACEVLEADDGGRAVELLRAELGAGRGVDFVLMDFTMVSMHGPQAAEMMRNDLHFQGVILGITGNALPADIAQFLQHGANEVLTKPLTRAKLLTQLRLYL
mmetsp:Transcript_10424/g.15702  ORF Transcript_10424/g.15702 Transcript_10424/m.15702 type:complete len:718 (-) Transcript_10424:314-2467(-)